MQVKVNKSSAVKAELIITNTKEEVNIAYENAYKLAKKGVKIAGFRKGKAPLNLVEQHLGESVYKNVAEELLHSNLNECLSTLKPNPVSMPEMTVVLCDRDKGAKFEGFYDLPPKIEIGKYKKIEVNEKKANVTSEDITTCLKAKQKLRSYMQPRDGGAKWDDTITFDLLISHNGKQLYKKNKITTSLSQKEDEHEHHHEHSHKDGQHDHFHFLPNMAEKILGMKEGEEISVQLELKKDFTDKKYAGKNLDLKIKLTACHYNSMPTIDDEFAKDLGNFENLSQLKEEIRNRILKYIGDVVKLDTKEEIIVKVIADSKINFPKSMLDMKYKSRLESIFKELGIVRPEKVSDNNHFEELSKITNTKPEELHTLLLEASEKSLRKEITCLEVANQEDIKLSDDEIKEYLKRYQIKISEDKKEIDKFIENLRVAYDGPYAGLYQSIVQDKTLEFIYENAKRNIKGEVTVKQLIEEGKIDSKFYTWIV